MIRRIILMLILSILITSCGGAAATAVEAPATQAPAATEAFGGPLNPPTPERPTATVTPAATDTPAVTPTDTPLPTLELPTEVVNAPARLVWDGVPTYPAESTPGFDFRVTYDPDIWALTNDQFGFPTLAHRTIANCIISETSGRGLPRNLIVEHDMLRLENVTFDVGTVYENGVKKFVTYTGGDANVITAFEVSFDEESDACLADAVAVLSTLRSVPASRATPTLTP